MSYSVPKMVLRNVALQTLFIIISAVTIPNIICVFEWVTLPYYFNRLAGITNVALLVPPLVQPISSTADVKYTACPVQRMSSTKHVQYNACIVQRMYSTTQVQYNACPVQRMSSTKHV